MNLFKKLINSAKFLVVTFSFLSLLTFCFPTTAMAAQPIDENVSALLEKCLDIDSGEFSYTNTKFIPSPATITSAKVVLPDGEFGLIKSISITRDLDNGQKQIEFGCQNLKVQNGTDLIKSCGGFAYLQKGNTTYAASGTAFQPQTELKFCVDLGDN